MPRRRPADKDAPAHPPHPARPPKLRPRKLNADPERYPDLARHPELERALRIRQALLLGHSRDEAIQMAHAAMGERAPHMSPAPKPKKKPTRPS
ncbi:MAG: hypothetical protein QOI63_1112 [Thermoplasmata archaeon]|nr:hypothetical protein [Thermoplasmata archaeon]